jgi:hypothetical protein
MLKSLKDVEIVGGTVTYVFLSERWEEPTEANPTGVVIKKTVMKAAINSEVFFKMLEGKRVRRSPHEVLTVFKETAWDLGASEFIIN